MDERKIPIETDLLDLIVGMTKADPKLRYTVKDIQNHKWVKGDTAKPE
jgi:hypothetical protein